ncbi:MAG: carbohydrate ABC transporter permease, partial [Bifidobacterium sp.]|nr:carbohydrate ABC transporter permease [Bifidobacterium sp.]
MENTQDMARSGARRVRRLIGGRTLGDWVADLIIVLILLLIVASILYPIWFIIIASVSDQTLVNTGQVTWFPKGISAYGFQQILGDDRIWNGYRNTLIYTVAGTVLNLVVTMPAAFALSRPEFKWRRLIMLFFTITMFVNGGLIPTYLL